MKYFRTMTNVLRALQIIAALALTVLMVKAIKVLLALAQ